jgi:hypothetical protein
MHTVCGLNTDDRTVQMVMELDFKYKTGEVLNRVPSILASFDPKDQATPLSPLQQRIVSPDELAFPFVFTNGVELTIHRELHFFKKMASGDSIPSMYDEDGLESGDRSLSLLRDEKGTAVMWKCEKYYLTVKLQAWFNDGDLPFSKLCLFIKLATTGAPGCASLHLKCDRSDTVFRFPLELGNFEADERLTIDSSSVLLAKCYVNEVELNLAASYPRLYMCAWYNNDWHMHVFKYYFVPMTLTICLSMADFELTEFVSFAASLILSDIALLFTITKATTITGEGTYCTVATSLFLSVCPQLTLL